MKGSFISSSMGGHGATTRRGFLKACSTAAIAFVGASALPTTIRKAWAGVPVWATIPDQVWAVGVPVYLDLADYCTDPDGDPLRFFLNQPLPPNVTLNGSVISGIPSTLFSTTQIVAIADDQGAVTGIPSEGQPPPVRPHLVPMPNPSSGVVRILGERGGTLESIGTLSVFAVSGRLVYGRAIRVAGSHYEVEWNGRTADGTRVPSGVYLVNVKIGPETARTRVVIAQ